MIKLASIFTKSLSALVGLVAMAAVFASPAAAQTANKLKCNGCVKSKQIGNNKIKSVDIKDGQLTGTDMNANISVGTASDDGDLGVKNTAGTETVSLDGATGNLTNLFANVPDQSNGLVKAWAKINENGSIESCWRCNTDTNETGIVIAGFYEVDFTPLATDIRARPRAATVDLHDGNGVLDKIIITGLSTDASTVNVFVLVAGAGLANESFTILIY